MTPSDLTVAALALKLREHGIRCIDQTAVAVPEVDGSL